MDAKKLIEMKKEYEATVKAHAKPVIAQLFKEFFTAVGDEVVAVKWSQYTPHFADGDPCIFSVNELEYKLKGAKGDEGDHEDGFVYYLADDSKVSGPADVLQTQVNSLEDVFLAAFDDGYEVTVTPDGKFESEEYEHD